MASPQREYVSLTLFRVAGIRRQWKADSFRVGFAIVFEFSATATPRTDFSPPPRPTWLCHMEAFVSMFYHKLFDIWDHIFSIFLRAQQCV